MSNSAIIYNSRTLNLGQKPYRFMPNLSGFALNTATPTSVAETLNVRSGFSLLAGFRLYENANATDATLKRNLDQWYEWARQGKTWYFAYDASDAVLTTLSVGAAAGDSALTPTSLTGITSGGLYVLRSLTQRTLIKVSALNSPLAGQIALTETLDLDFLSGSRLRSQFYFPARLRDLAKYPLIEREPLHFDLELDVMEDVNAL